MLRVSTFQVIITITHAIYDIKDNYMFYIAFISCIACVILLMTHVALLHT